MEEKVLLDLKHFWQLSKDIQLPLEEKKSLCAIVAMKMIVDYWLDNSITIESLKELVEQSGGRAANGDWLQSAEVEAFKKIGFVSWRRNWNLAKRDYEYLKEKENYSIDQLKLLQFQHFGAALPSIINSLKLGLPLIASVKKDFEDNAKNHQIVIRGFARKDNKIDIYYLDPFLPYEEQLERSSVGLSEFLFFFNYQAIFVVPDNFKENFFDQKLF